MLLFGRQIEKRLRLRPDVLDEGLRDAMVDDGEKARRAADIVDLVGKRGSLVCGCPLEPAKIQNRELLCSHGRPLPLDDFDHKPRFPRWRPTGPTLSPPQPRRSIRPSVRRATFGRQLRSFEIFLHPAFLLRGGGGPDFRRYNRVGP
jgi:hypothetical protein